MNKERLLWNYECTFKEYLNECLNDLETEEMSIQDLLDMGFNNSHLLIDNYCYELGYKDLEGNYNSPIKLTKKILNMKIKLSYTDYDYDLYTIVYVELVNEKDKKDFLERMKKNESK